MRRVRVQTWLAGAFFVAAAITAVWPDWIEALGLGDRDHGNGSAEWAFVAMFAIAAVVSGALATRSRRRLRAAHAEV